MLLTADFSSSDLFELLMIKELFYWQIQHRSDIGFVISTCGRYLDKMFQNEQ